MSNFNFLLKCPEYEYFSDACIEAEALIIQTPTTAAISIRRAVELCVNWICRVNNREDVIKLSTLNERINTNFFVTGVPYAVRKNIIFSIQLGNRAVHSNENIGYEKALTSLKNLFDFIQWIDCKYGHNYNDKRIFKESNIPEKSSNKNIKREKNTVENLQKINDDNSGAYHNSDFETEKVTTENALCCCYANSISEFLSIGYKTWAAQMLGNYCIIHGEKPSEQQLLAWKDCYDCTRDFFEACSKYQCNLVFEYILPYEGGRRPDLVILSGNNLIVFEYKMSDGVKLAYMDQLSGYARDIKGYHKASSELNVIPVLVPTKSAGKYKWAEEVLICSPDKLTEQLLPYLNTDECPDLNSWISSAYEPLPSLIDAAKIVYFSQKLPHIRKANSAGIPDAVSYILKAVDEAEKNKSRVLVLVTGVPGAGKTLLGLDLVYKANVKKTLKSTFLSGNGPLVDVLQDALKSKTFVKPLRNYVNEYGKLQRGVPSEKIVVFDEAQRAWDKQQVFAKRDINKSEPDLIIEIADRIPDWCVMVGLIGEGQEIYIGEESGIGQWNEALKNSKSSWKVICPEKLSNMFTNATEVDVSEKLNLTISLRSHLSDDVSAWVATVLENKLSHAQDLSKKIFENGFKIYVTDSLDKAKRYCHRRYNNQDKTYGLVCSSKARILPRYGVNNDFNSTKNMSVAKWFNAPPGDESSCRSFNNAVTEFACQGLELDMPIMCWGEDFRWENGELKLCSSGGGFKDPYQIRLNCYRVLLTRGRDGMIIYVPEDETLKETYIALLNSGARKLI